MAGQPWVEHGHDALWRCRERWRTTLRLPTYGLTRQGRLQCFGFMQLLGVTGSRPTTDRIDATVLLADCTRRQGACHAEGAVPDLAGCSCGCFIFDHAIVG